MTVSALPVLDLAELPGGRSGVAASAPRRARIGAVAVALAIGAAVALGAGHFLSDLAAPVPPVVRLAIPAASKVAALTVDDRSQILAEGTDAQTRNAAIPFAVGKTAPMGAFLIHASAPAAANALKCLTQAIYYEAATEPLEGRRAVAQVVLNRVRHPAYPKSVCGVVYEGAERPTGCQFSFTCDGALLRQPMARLWREDEEIAREALAGRVETSVGTATHYHADYVLPRWAFELAKVNKLGRHLFYRFEGAWGRPAIFSGHYSGAENIPALDFARLRARLAAAGAGAEPLASFAPGLTVAPQVTDRHADNDVGGRLDMTRPWRLAIPDPTASSSHYRELVEGKDGAAGKTSVPTLAAAEVTK